ncbi:MAG: PEP-CTERM sorting domain-containing protein [Iphinoe sp. HA4291-MV1]|jgi:amidase|nr:PEP-CTERM sorting domain-containing protein [Iphinoe sp. HA4291-MV1]
MRLLKQSPLLAAQVVMLGIFPTAVLASTFKLEEATIPDVNAAFEAGTLTSQELTQMYLDRIATYDQAGPKLNSIGFLNPNVLQEAAQLDALRTQGTILGPLHGIPVVVKDSYNVKGLPTTNGVEAFKSLIATEDAFAVKKLKQAGAVILGKANMSTWAFSYDGVSEAYGSVINPYAPDRTPGGSSSGSAVSVAANLTILAMGGETGGSIRVPSTHNALVGLKPTAGLISVDGIWPLTPERDVIGPMARTVADVAIAMDTLVDFDPNNIWNPYIPGNIRPNSYINFLDDTSLQGKTLGLPRPYIGKGDPEKGESYPIDPQIAAAFEQAKMALEAQGAKLVEVDIPAHKTWFIDVGPEDYPRSNKRVDQNRAYYYEQLIKEYNDDEIKSFVDLLNIIPEDNLNYSYIKNIAEVIAAGEAKPWEELPEVAQALQALARLRTEEYEDFMTANSIDAFVFPTLNYLAPPQGDAGEGVYEIYGSLPARFEANILGLPAITVPMGFSVEGIPMSLEFLGNYFGEAEIISYAYDYERATKLRRPPVLVPEPTTVPALVLLGLGFLIFRLKRRHRIKRDCWTVHYEQVLIFLLSL